MNPPNKPRDPYILPIIYALLGVFSLIFALFSNYAHTLPTFLVIILFGAGIALCLLAILRGIFPSKNT